MYRILLFLYISLIACTGLAQDDDGLTTEDVVISTETDIFGQEVHIAEGVLVNTSDDTAYAGIDLFADVLDAEGEVVGEGFGFPVNACGVGLLDFALQPGQEQTFRLQLELFEDVPVQNDEEGDEDAGENVNDIIDSVEIFPEGVATEPSNNPQSDDLTGITQISTKEVVNVEWYGDDPLIYAVGCDADVFTAQQWYVYDFEEGQSRRTPHPDAQRVTNALLTQLGLTDPFFYNRSYLTFAPTSRRLVYQDDIQTLLTAEPDGSFKRLIYEDLSRRSLHGFIWLPEGRFLAYYYGAYGEEVRYFTASVEGQRISADLYTVTPSMTVPGPTSDGARVVITTTVEDVTGYYLKDAFFPAVDLLFETDAIPGNNYPAPLYTTDNGEPHIYIVRPVDDVPLLQCFNQNTGELNDLTALPLNLTTDDRAWTWLSPDGNTIALAANGVDGGLWLIDLPTFGGCNGPEIAG